MLAERQKILNSNCFRSQRLFHGRNPKITHKLQTMVTPTKTKKVEVAVTRTKKKSCFFSCKVISILILIIFPVSVYQYTSYLTTSICPLNEKITSSPFESVTVNEYSTYPSVNDVACYGLHQYVHPAYDKHIDPLVTEHVTPRWEELDEKFAITDKYTQIIDHIQSTDRKWGISAGISAFASDSWRLTKRNLRFIQALTEKQFNDTIYPALESTLDATSNFCERWFNIISDYVVIKSKVLSIRLHYEYELFHTNHILPNYIKAERWISHHTSPYTAKLHEYYLLSKLDLVVAYVSQVFDLLYTKGNDIYERKLQAKHHFLRDELYTLLKFKPNDAPKVKSEESIVEVVKDILDVVEEKAEEYEHEVEETFESATSKVKEVLSTEGEEEESSDSEYDDAEETLTLRVTSTITVVNEAKETSDAEEVGLNTESFNAEVDSTAYDKIEEELSYWRNKVNKTCVAAWTNLDKDIAEFTHQLLEESIKTNVSAKLTFIQKTNFEAYKYMNQLIEYIDKDSIKIKEQKRHIRSQEDEGDDGNVYVCRQDMRDEITKSKEFVQGQVDSIKAYLTEANSELLKEYFKKAQDVIDVLESFAELTIQEFSSRLHTLLSIVEQEVGEDVDEWNAWKEFHKIKESIFTTRDEIFNHVYQYKTNYLFENEDAESIVIPNGFAEWEGYLQNIHFHANFLINDNTEYLGLVRAKANLAYQMRTQTEFELDEEIERIRLEKEEEEKRLLLQTEKEGEEEEEEEEEEEKVEEEEDKEEEGDKEEEVAEEATVEDNSASEGEDYEYVVEEILIEEEEDLDAPLREEEEEEDED